MPPPPAARAPVYSFHPDADELFRLLFPTGVRARGVTHAFARRGRERAPATLEVVTSVHVRSANPASSEGVSWTVDPDSAESAWHHEIRLLGNGRKLLDLSGRVSELAGALVEAPLRFRSVMEKALLQRYLHQMCLLCQDAIARESDSAVQAAGWSALRSLAQALFRCSLSEEEFRALRSLLPARVPEGRFATGRGFDLGRDYLPSRVVGPDAGWVEIPFRVDETLHFKHYRGTSFVRVFIRPEGMSEERFFAYWDDLTRRFGERIPMDGRAPPLPAGTETLLVRTFAVRLESGEYADSGFPEEVTLRAFRFAEERLDPESSDFRGTYLYQYKMRRRLLLADPGSLGLARIRDDDPAFFGFFTEVPPPGGVAGVYLTTRRNNCISCHSEMYYGVNTVFSLARGRPRGGEPAPPGGEPAPIPSGRPDRWWFRDSDHRALEALR